MHIPTDCVCNEWTKSAKSTGAKSINVLFNSCGLIDLKK